MKLKNLNKALVGGAVALTAASGLIASTMVSASADPTRPYAATGSDTIQDVWNGLTNDFGAVAPSIASWNAFVVPASTVPASSASSYIQTKTGGAWFIRPAGSGDGQKSLSAVWDPGYASHLWGQTSPINNQVALTHEDVDFARSSGGPATGTGLKFLPFARDAVAIAFHPSGALTGPLNLTTTEIASLYNGVADPSDPTVSFSAQPATVSTIVSINGVPVQPQIPQNGSGTRKFFLSAIGVTTAQLAPYIPNPNVGLPTGLPENDGNAIPNPGDLIPFSAAQWISQQNGNATNTTTGLAISSVNGLAPTTGSAPTESAGVLFGHKNLSGKFDTVPTSGVGNFNRDTYDVVPTAFLTGTAKQQALISILGAGIGGAGGANVITAYGFGVLSYIGDTSKFLDGLWQH